MNNERLIYSVKNVNAYIKTLLNNDENLINIWIKGEISNYKVGPSGHIYFSIKDEEALINAVMFSWNVPKVNFPIENGKQVIVKASLDAYIARGTYQLIVSYMEEDGLGKQLLELEQLKQALFKEGLFDESRKRPIKKFPNSIGIITARNSAAIKDILFNIKSRYPLVDIYVKYASVQGENAPKELLDAFLEMNELPLDTLIIGRGGGASEDLSAFNDEALVRALATSKMPLISAVGHEIDFTLTDLVADVRVSTPTGAAVKATPDKLEIFKDLDTSLLAIKNAISNKVKSMNDDVDEINDDLNNSVRNYLADLNKEITHLDEKLDILNPKEILKRGYSITLDSCGKAIKSVSKIKANQEIKTVFKDGSVISNVIDIKKEK